jgi:hypothetical protein
MAFRLENRIGVATPPHVIWEVIEDLPAWRRWNPFYTDAQGRFGFGETLTLTMSLPGREPQVIRPVVSDWTPGELVHWNLKLFNGLVRTTRYIEIEKLTETGCIFSNGEIFHGLLSRYVPPKLRRAVRQGFNAMGEAVKREAEARYVAAGGEPAAEAQAAS